MRVFAISDVHVDYEVNARWVAALSSVDYRHDILILAGDVSDSLARLRWCFAMLTARFRVVLYVPGNHDLWVIRDGRDWTSVQKFEEVCRVAREYGVHLEPFAMGQLTVVPMLGWYDRTFGQPQSELGAIWMDYRACRWSKSWDADDISVYFTGLNEPVLSTRNEVLISFSHFLPRLDLVPGYGSRRATLLAPVLGTTKLQGQIRTLGSRIHVYGHSHVNQCMVLDGIMYVNNAFGSPAETRWTRKDLRCVYEA